MKLRKKSFLKFLIFISIIFLTLNSNQSLITVKAQSYTNVSVHEAYSMINNNTAFPDLLILDVRNQDEYNSERICNATLIPVSAIESRISGLLPYNDTEIIVYCRSGSRSASASQILISHNFTKVFNMREGISAWTSAGYETCGLSQPIISFYINVFLVMALCFSIFLIVLCKKKISIK